MGQFAFGLVAGIVVGLVMEWVIDWTGLLPRRSAGKKRSQEAEPGAPASVTRAGEQTPAGTYTSNPHTDASGE